MTLQETIDELYRQLKTAKSKYKKKDLYKGIKRLEGKRRKEKCKNVV